MDVKIWIMNWFSEKSGISKEELEKKMDSNYFECGYVDSFGFITLISDIEDSFGVEFNNDEFENRNFATITGLIDCIKGKIK